MVYFARKYFINSCHPLQLGSFMIQGAFLPFPFFNYVALQHFLIRRLHEHEFTIDAGLIDLFFYP
jgi:hypothetical protein